LAGKSRFDVQIVPIGQEMRPGRALKKAIKERKKNKKKLTDVTSHAQATHVVLPLTKLSCVVGSRT